MKHKHNRKNENKRFFFSNKITKIRKRNNTRSREIALLHSTHKQSIRQKKWQKITIHLLHNINWIFSKRIFVCVSCMRESYLNVFAFSLCYCLRTVLFFFLLFLLAISVSFAFSRFSLFAHLLLPESCCRCFEVIWKRKYDKKASNNN